jgi:hypothetical protein
LVQRKSTFKVHKDLIISKAEFFRAALGTDFIESRTDEITMDEDDTFAVEVFLNWAYADKIMLTYEFHTDGNPQFARSYAFGKKICSEAFCNDLVDFVKYHTEKESLVPHEKDLAKFYDLGLGSSALARLFRNITVFVMHEYPERYMPEGDFGFADARESWADHNDLLLDMLYDMIEAKRKALTTDPWTLGGCHYHEHITSSPCKAGSNTGEASTRNE